MISRRTSSSTNSLGLILGVTIPLIVLAILLPLLIIWHLRLRNARTKTRSKLPPLALHRAPSEKYSAPNSASSYASTFTFPQKNNDNTLDDLKDPFRFPMPLEKPVPLAPLPPLPSQAVVLTAYRAHAAPPPRKVDMDKTPIASTQDSLHPSASYKQDDGKDDPEGWELSYYEEALPSTRPPSYHRAPSRIRSHSPVSNSLRSGPLRQTGVLSRKPSANTGTRPLSQPIDTTVSTNAHVHINSLYVESHSGADEQMVGSDDNLRIMSIAPQIPSIYLGIPFEAFAKLEGELEEGVVGVEKLGESIPPECTLDHPQTINVTHSLRQGSSPTAITTGVHSDQAAVKASRTIPAGWF